MSRLTAWTNARGLRRRRATVRAAILMACGVVGVFVSGGCGVRGRQNAQTPLDAGRHERSLRVDRRVRSYIVEVPSVVAEGRPLPVILALHGAAGTPDSFDAATELGSTGARAGFAVAYLSGVGRTWNAGRCCGPAERRNVDDVAYVKAVIDDLAGALPVDRRRIYATGFSNGALMTYRLACDAADRIAGIVAVGGAMALEDEQCRPARPVPVLHIHGSADRFAPLHGGETAVPLLEDQPSVLDTIDFWVRSNQCAQAGERTMVGIVRAVRYAQCANDTEVVLDVVEGLGHQWPGPEPAVAEGFFGPDTDEVSASRLAVRFFAQHPPVGSVPSG